MAYEITVKTMKVSKQREEFFNDGAITKWFETEREIIEADGFFLHPFFKPSTTQDELIDTNSCASVNFRNIDEDNKERNYNLLIYLQENDKFNDNQSNLNLTFFLDSKTIEFVKSIAKDKQSELVINFEIVEWIESEDSYGDTAKALVTRIDNSRLHSNKELIDYKIKDIKNYLIGKCCVDSNYGQVADICKEFAESFRAVPLGVDKNELIEEIISAIHSLRFTFHSYLNEDDSKTIKYFYEKYNFSLKTYSERIIEEFNKITDEKDRHVAVKIYNHFWTARKAEDMFKNGFPIGSGEVESIAEEYIKLKYVKSETVEKILVDLLIATTIGDKASYLQFNKQISAKTLLSIPADFYTKETNSKITDLKFKDALAVCLVYASIHLSLKVIFGLFEWWFSGLIAGDNETAHIILFGTLFAADSILTYQYQKSTDTNFASDVTNKNDEENFYVFRDLCKLHKLSSVYKSSSFKSLLNKVVCNGTNFPISLHVIVDR
jgi:hypothetical protein